MVPGDKGNADAMIALYPYENAMRSCFGRTCGFLAVEHDRIGFEQWQRVLQSIVGYCHIRMRKHLPQGREASVAKQVERTCRILIFSLHSPFLGIPYSQCLP